MDQLIDKKEMVQRLRSAKMVKRVLYHWLTPVVPGRGKRKTLVGRPDFDRAMALINAGKIPEQLPSDGGLGRTGWPILDQKMSDRISRIANDASRVRDCYRNRQVFSVEDISPVREGTKIRWLIENAGKLPMEAVPVECLHLDPARFQWKAMNCNQTGTNAEERLGGTFTQALAGIVTCYQEADKLYILDGHHRYDLALRSGAAWLYVRAIPSSVFSVMDAHVLGMLLNLADGHGSIRDQIRAMDKIQVLQYGGLNDIKPYVQNRGNAAFTLFSQAVPETIAMVVNDRISTTKAQAIAEAAPNHRALQVLGLKEALKHPQLNARILGLHIRQLSKLAPRQHSEEVDGTLWAPDEQWLQVSRETAKRVDGLRRDIDTRIRSARGAAANPDAAASLGVHVSSREATEEGIQRLLGLRQQLEGWRSSTRIISQVEKELESL